jgi:hypothetical protein
LNYNFVITSIDDHTGYPYELSAGAWAMMIKYVTVVENIANEVERSIGKNPMPKRGSFHF